MNLPTRHSGTRLAAATPLLHDFLDAAMQRDDARVAVVAGPHRWTYGQLTTMANALAHKLRACGVRRGDRVAVFADNRAEVVAAFWAIHKADAVVVIVNPLTRTDKLRRLLADCGAVALVADATLAPTFVPAVAELGLRAVVLTDGGLAMATAASAVPAPAQLVVPADLPVLDWATAVADDGTAPPPRHNIDRDLACIIYTSGSTGSPKGVMLSHHNMRSAATALSAVIDSRADDVILSALPLAFNYGLYQMILAAYAGAQLILERSLTFLTPVLQRMEREKVTAFPGVPTIFAMFAGVKNLADYDFSAMRYVTNTAAPLQPAHRAVLAQMFPNASIYSMYGLTECKRCTWLPPADLARKPDSVGLPMPNIECWVVDETGTRLGANQVGELVVRGSNVMRGYWNKPEETAACLRPGATPGEVVFYTGDLCRFDEEGYLYFVARKDDIIKSRGEKVAPREVEAVLHELSNVKEAAVIGVPDAVLGFAIKAFVVLHDEAARDGASCDAATVLRHCKARLEAYMVPTYIEFLSELPKTDTGKITKSELR
ncbi:MAG: acyl--CoA ligase [Kofleriaceae bacterium]|nr:acyl--CoA ligase [Kofleriaceae bacterium]